MLFNNKYFYYYIENPLKTYNKVKKYFKPLKINWEFFCQKLNNTAKIVDISSFDIGWKSKYNSPRHEYNPYIEIVLFKRIGVRITFIASDYMTDVAYWEAILYWVYFGKSLSVAISESTGWSEYNKETEKYEPIKFKLLKEPYQTMYEQNKLPLIKYETHNGN